MNAQTNAANNAHSDETLDDMGLDETLDDLADLPQTKPFPAGAHLVDITIRRNAKKPGQYIVEQKYRELVELTAEVDEDQLPKAGDKSTIFIATKKKDGSPNEIGQGQIKLIMKPIATMLGSNVIADVIAATANGLTAMVVVKVRKDTKGEYDDQQEIIKLDLV